MQEVKFTDKKICPFCGGKNIEFLDLSDILGLSPHYNHRFHVNRYVFRCRDCRELFYYTGKIDSKLKKSQVELSDLQYVLYEKFIYKEEV